MLNNKNKKIIEERSGANFIGKAIILINILSIFFSLEMELSAQYKYFSFN